MTILKRFNAQQDRNPKIARSITDNPRKTGNLVFNPYLPKKPADNSEDQQKKGEMP